MQQAGWWTNRVRTRGQGGFSAMGVLMSLAASATVARVLVTHGGGPVAAAEQTACEYDKRIVITAIDAEGRRHHAAQVLKVLKLLAELFDLRIEDVGDERFRAVLGGVRQLEPEAGVDRGHGLLRLRKSIHGHNENITRTNRKRIRYKLDHMEHKENK